VIDTEGDAQKFAASLSGNRLQSRRVYVVGMSEETEFARACTDEPTEYITLRSLDAKTMLQFRFSEAIGTEASHATFEHLIEMAKQRAAALQK
jgi:hypothetical protein